MANWLAKLFSSARQTAPAVAHAAARTAAEAHKNQGNTQLAAGALEAAADCYRQAIATDPAYAEAFNNLGFVLHQLGLTDEALHALQQAIRLNPQLANAHFNLGTLAEEIGDTDQAISCYRALVSLQPENADTHNRLGVLLATQGKLEQAVACFETAIAQNPDFAEARYNLGNLLFERGRPGDALPHLQHALRLAPGFVQAHYCLGNAWLDAGHPDEALACFQQAIALNPQHAGAHNNAGTLLMKQGRLDEAITLLRRAIALAPNSAQFHNNLGLALHDQGKLNDAINAYRTAIAFKPDFGDAYNNLGRALQHQGFLDKAITSYQQALSLKTKDRSPGFNLALALLSRGELAEGWEQYKYRFSFNSGALWRDLPLPLWRGEPLEGKTLLIWGEQGVGDEILQSSMFQEMIERTRRCVIACIPKLVPLFTRSFPAARVIPRSDLTLPGTLDGIDLQCAAGSLPRWLRPTLESFPSGNGYLLPDPTRVAFWRSRLAALGPGPKIGFAWRSSNVSGVRHLYCTALDQWGPIFAVPGMQFINLQYDRCINEITDAGQRFGVSLHAFQEVDLFNDLAEAAALTQAHDLVISAPTASSFLAGALGVPTWVMTHGIPWQTLGTDRFPWFPAMRCFSRSWETDWHEVIAAVARELPICFDTRART